MHLILFYAARFHGAEKQLGTVLAIDEVKVMLRNRQYRIYLIAYLALFLNMGPSFHRVPIFGLHSDSASCSCCQISKTDFGTQSATVQSPLSECSLCKYFEQFNVDLDVDRFSTDFQKVLFLIHADLVDGFATPIRQMARGPPHHESSMDFS